MPEFLGQLVLAERGGGFGIDPFEQARQHLRRSAVAIAASRCGAGADVRPITVLHPGTVADCSGKQSGASVMGLYAAKMQRMRLSPAH